MTCMTTKNFGDVGDEEERTTFDCDEPSRVFIVHATKSTCAAATFKGAVPEELQAMRVMAPAPFW